MITRRWPGKTCSLLLLVLFFLLVSTEQSRSEPAYEIGPRDVLTVVVFAGGTEQVKVDLTISDQGTVNFPFIGPLKAGGFSSSALEEQVKKLLGSDYFVNPEVHVQVKEYNSLQYSISGAVKKPGNYKMLSKPRVFDLITKAEGVVADAGNVAYIMREGATVPDKVKKNQGNSVTSPIKIDLLELLDKGDFTHNVQLQTGDSVYIPFATGLDQSDSKIFVSGEVARPGVYDYQVGLTALGACILAGDFTKFAAPNRATLIRMENETQTIIRIDIEEVITGKKADVSLKPGDRLTIPESWF